MKDRNLLKTAILVITVLSICTIIHSPVLAQSFPQWGDLKPGAYAVGFIVKYEYDKSRTFAKPGAEQDKASKSRPIQISIWYPAEKTSNPSHMLYQDYVHLMATEIDFGELTPESKALSEKKFKSMPFSDTLSGETVKQVMKIKTGAIMDAVGSKGSYPVFVMAQGNHGSSYHHSILSEYLASHGYIVVTSPSSTRYVYEEMTMQVNPAVFQDQMHDILYLMKYISAIPNADEENIILGGFSLGGNTGGFALLHSEIIDAVVCIECGMGSKFGTPLLKNSPQFEKAKTRRLAFLNIHKLPDPMTDYSFIEAFKNSDSYMYGLNGLKHYNFTSLGMLAALNTELIGQPNWLVGGRKARLGYETIARYVLNFLNAYFKGDQQGISFLRNQPEKNGLPKDFMIQKTYHAKEVF